MSKTILTLKERPHVPLEAEALTPDVIAPLSHNEVRALPVVLGKRQRRVDDFFEVEGPGSEELEIRGDAGRVKWIGRGMTRGRITIAGDAADLQLLAARPLDLEEVIQAALPLAQDDR